MLLLLLRLELLRLRRLRRRRRLLPRELLWHLSLPPQELLPRLLRLPWGPPGAGLPACVHGRVLRRGGRLDG